MGARMQDELEVLQDDQGYWLLGRVYAASRGVEIPYLAPPAHASVFWRRRYVASVGAVEIGCDIFFEWLVVVDRGDVPARLRHAAVEKLMRYGIEYARARGKRPMMVVDVRRGGRGIAAMARRLGLATRNEHLWVLEGKMDSENEAFNKRFNVPPPADPDLTIQKRDPIEALAHVTAELCRELAGFSRYCARLEQRLDGLEAAQRTFSAEDIELIKAHVRHPGALEAAKLRERLRMVREALGGEP